MALVATVEPQPVLSLASQSALRSTLWATCWSQMQITIECAGSPLELVSSPRWLETVSLVSVATAVLQLVHVCGLHTGSPWMPRETFSWQNGAISVCEKFQLIRASFRPWQATGCRASVAMVAPPLVPAFSILYTLHSIRWETCLLLMLKIIACAWSQPQLGSLLLWPATGPLHLVAMAVRLQARASALPRQSLLPPESFSSSIAGIIG